MRWTCHSRRRAIGFKTALNRTTSNWKHLTRSILIPSAWLIPTILTSRKLTRILEEVGNNQDKRNRSTKSYTKRKKKLMNSPSNLKKRR
jgi:hypothetical protein